MNRGPRYVPGDMWFAGPRCNGYAKGDILRILRVSGEGSSKKLLVTDAEGNESWVSFKTLWKKVKTSRKRM